jgi:hypothetical protein
MMMNDAYPGGDGPFAALDPKLTVFALANGVDLSKGEDYRRIEWFSEGWERGILIGLDGPEAFTVVLFRWRTGDSEASEPTPFREGVDIEAVVGLLDDAVQAANAL